VTRSNRPDVRNPLIALPAAQAIRSLSADSRLALRILLGQIAEDAARRAEESWRKSKGPMAAYWKAVSVYAKHARRLTR
jgi:hypothetical protein